MPKPITALGFRGMNNLETAPSVLLDDAKRITPKYAVNVEVTDGGKLVERQGYQLHIALPGAHSLWSGSIMLVAAEGVLYRVEGETTTPITTIAGPTEPVCYQEIENLVYMATTRWSSIYNLTSGATRSWGLPLPPAPDVDLVAGDLPPGAYSIAFTRSESDRLSGNGPLTQLSWEGQGHGIRLNNLPVGGQAWITHPNGTDLLLAEVDEGVIVGQAPYVIPLPSFKVAPPEGLSHFAYAFGRIWGASGKRLVYSDHFQFEWFRQGGFKPFLEDLIMVAPVNEGIFVNSIKSTWFLEGTDPAKMTLKRIGDGAVPGTLVYGEMPGAVVGGGYEMSRRLSQLPSPVWIGPHGYVVGTQTGHLVHLTASRLRMPVRFRGSSVFRVKNGVPQIITVQSGPLTEGSGPALPIFEDNNLFD